MPLCVTSSFGANTIRGFESVGVGGSGGSGAEAPFQSPSFASSSLSMSADRKSP